MMDEKPRFNSEEEAAFHAELSSRMSEDGVFRVADALIRELDELRYTEGKEAQRKYDSFVSHIQKMLDSDRFTDRHIKKYKHLADWFYDQIYLDYEYRRYLLCYPDKDLLSEILEALTTPDHPATHNLKNRLTIPTSTDVWRCVYWHLSALKMYQRRNQRLKYRKASVVGLDFHREALVTGNQHISEYLRCDYEIPADISDEVLGEISTHRDKERLSLTPFRHASITGEAGTIGISSLAWDLGYWPLSSYDENLFLEKRGCGGSFHIHPVPAYLEFGHGAVVTPTSL